MPAAKRPADGAMACGRPVLASLCLTAAVGFGMTVVLVDTAGDSLTLVFVSGMIATGTAQNASTVRVA